MTGPDYTDPCEMTEAFLSEFGREPTGEELADYMVDQFAFMADQMMDALRDRESGL